MTIFTRTRNKENNTKTTSAVSCGDCWHRPVPVTEAESRFTASQVFLAYLTDVEDLSHVVSFSKIIDKLTTSVSPVRSYGPIVWPRKTKRRLVSQGNPVLPECIWRVVPLVSSSLVESTKCSDHTGQRWTTCGSKNHFKNLPFLSFLHKMVRRSCLASCMTFVH